MGIPFIFGGAAVIRENTLALNISPVIYVIALIAFLAGAGREIMKDSMDFKGDKVKGVKSFPKYIGIRKSNILSAFFYIIAIALSFLPFFVSDYGFYYLNYYYLILIFITDTMLLSTSLQLIFKKQVNLNYHRKFTLIALCFGLLSFLVGVFVYI